jgi:hypothetical protein
MTKEISHAQRSALAALGLSPSEIADELRAEGDELRVWYHEHGEAVAHTLLTAKGKLLASLMTQAMRGHVGAAGRMLQHFDQAMGRLVDPPPVAQPPRKKGRWGR